MIRIQGIMMVMKYSCSSLSLYHGEALLVLGIKVHVQVGQAIRLVLDKVCEGHLCPRNPLQPCVPVSIQSSQPVVSPVLVQ